ncbi:MAG: alanyl-tRNA editing protein [Lachnospiraceae bacterium]|nr:alanyl-tRNA editing protein [Lachnospiraceae bacterium]
MTEKLYDNDAYASKFGATVLSCEEDKKDFKVVLDKTLFFPEEGGQTPDRGTINGIEVTHVAIKDDVITHYLEAPIAAGTEVEGEIDFTHRFRNMQMHSAEHIFSGLVFKHFGFNNVGFHLSDNSATMDYDGKFTYEDALKLEKEANEIIIKGKTITAEYPSSDVLATLEYRSKKALSGPIRIVTVEDTDICACCAPHVHNTHEIGQFKIVSFENYKSGVRVGYLAGFRALEDYERKLSDLREISRTISAKAGDELKGVAKLCEDINAYKFKDIELKNKYIELKIQSELKDRDIGICVLPAEFSSCMQFASDALKEHYEGVTVVLCGDDDNGYRFYVESDTIDLIKILADIKNSMKVKGGGKSAAIQGTVIGKSADFCSFF